MNNKIFSFVLLFFVFGISFSPNVTLAARKTSVIISPATIEASQNLTYTYTVSNANDGTTTAGIGSIEIQLPTGFGTPSVAIVSASPSRTWAFSSTGGYVNGFNASTGKIGLKASGSGSKLSNNEFLSIQISSTAPVSLNTYEWTASVWANLDFTGTPIFELTSSQPTVTVADTTSPTITITGSNPQTILVGLPYVELGVTISDNVDNNLSATVDTSNVNINQVGSYVVTYDAVDLSGNHATQLTRTVNVVDQEAPIITLIGDNPQSIEVHGSYTELGATISDNVDVGLIATIDTNALDLNTLGIYSVTYNAIDSSGNNATEVTRVVHIVDTTKPIITLTGENTINLTVGDTYTEQGATTSDNYDNEITIIVAGDTVNTSQVGAYHITYNATDSSLNEATQVIRTVTVAEVTPSDVSVNISSLTPQIIITNPNQVVNITVENNTTDPSLDLGSFITSGSGSIPHINIISLQSGNVIVDIPATVVTSTDTNWNGIIALPKITTATLPETSGELKTLSTAIEVGSTDTKLSFDNAVRILLPKEASKKVGFSRVGTNFTEITNVCSSDSQASGDSLITDGDCKIDVGSDLVVWTKHFTVFATYTVTPVATQSGGGRGGRLPLPIAPIAQNISNTPPDTLTSNITAHIGVNREQVALVPNTTLEMPTPTKTKVVARTVLAKEQPRTQVIPETLTASAVNALPSNAFPNKIPVAIGVVSVIIFLFVAFKFFL